MEMKEGSSYRAQDGTEFKIVKILTDGDYPVLGYAYVADGDGLSRAQPRVTQWNPEGKNINGSDGDLIEELNWVDPERKLLDKIYDTQDEATKEELWRELAELKGWNIPQKRIYDNKSWLK